VGAIQYVLSIPSGPVLPFSQVQTFFVLKQYNQIYMSLAVYGLLLASILIYGEELIRFVQKMKEPKEIAGTLSTALIGLIVYPILRLFIHWTPLQAFFTALAAAMITGLVAVRVGIITPVAAGEGRIASGVEIPWDKLALQLAIGIFLIVLIGRV